MTNQVLALRERLIAEQVTLVVMEATGDYWKPFYYLPEDGPLRGPAGQRPAREEPAGTHGLVRGSFVPPEPIRQLRDLTRTTRIEVVIKPFRGAET